MFKIELLPRRRYINGASELRLQFKRSNASQFLLQGLLVSTLRPVDGGTLKTAISLVINRPSGNDVIMIFCPLGL